MMRTVFPLVFRTALVAVAALAGSQALAQAKPVPPRNLCVEGTTCATTSGNSMKWHPGHYVRALTTGTQKNTSARLAAYDAIRNNPHFAGGVINVTWAAVEPQKDVYDFSVIDRDL